MMAGKQLQTGGPESGGRYHVGSRSGANGNDESSRALYAPKQWGNHPVQASPAVEQGLQVAQGSHMAPQRKTRDHAPPGDRGDTLQRKALEGAVSELASRLVNVSVEGMGHVASTGTFQVMQSARDWSGKAFSLLGATTPLGLANIAMGAGNAAISAYTACAISNMEKDVKDGRRQLADAGVAVGHISHHTGRLREGASALGFGVHMIKNDVSELQEEVVHVSEDLMETLDRLALQLSQDIQSDFGGVTQEVNRGIESIKKRMEDEEVDELRLAYRKVHKRYTSCLLPLTKGVQPHQADVGRLVEAAENFAAKVEVSTEKIPSGDARRLPLLAFSTFAARTEVDARKMRALRGSSPAAQLDAYSIQLLDNVLTSIAVEVDAIWEQSEGRLFTIGIEMAPVLAHYATLGRLIDSDLRAATATRAPLSVTSAPPLALPAPSEATPGQASSLPPIGLVAATSAGLPSMSSGATSSRATSSGASSSATATPSLANENGDGGGHFYQGSSSASSRAVPGNGSGSFAGNSDGAESLGGWDGTIVARDNNSHRPLEDGLEDLREFFLSIVSAVATPALSHAASFNNRDAHGPESPDSADTYGTDEFDPDPPMRESFKLERISDLLWYAEWRGNSEDMYVDDIPYEVSVTELLADIGAPSWLAEGLKESMLPQLQKLVLSKYRAQAEKKFAEEFPWALRKGAKLHFQRDRLTRNSSGASSLSVTFE
eukprot:TRINITY_DN22118_c0_g1_i1.p1 TRINITY_DN22118_c0_g1~~TRINITY_DN22118_c0_g1_i1.p1  ORF type:complete len:718 (+),score=107.25 TRINITY_DN22118_c0_g1_i1:901-3054(+)